MRKLLIAFALIPAMSHAALLIDGTPQTGATAQVAQLTSAPAAPGAMGVATVTLPGAQAATQAVRITPLSEVWRTSPDDINMRLKISQWCGRVGWDCTYDVDKDVPIMGHDSFSGSFKEAVRRLLSTTEMTGYRIKPCFYTNNRVRVVKDTTKCDPSL